jgi:hypothetical protein
MIPVVSGLKRRPVVVYQGLIVGKRSPSVESDRSKQEISCQVARLDGHVEIKKRCPLPSFFHVGCWSSLVG